MSRGANLKAREKRAVKARRERYWEFLCLGQAISFMAMTNLMKDDPAMINALNKATMSISKKP